MRLYEGQKRFDIIYGPVGGGNTSATAGVQKNDTTFDSGLLQRRRRCGYWRAKLHDIAVWNPIAHTNSHSYSEADSHCDSYCHSYFTV